MGIGGVILGIAAENTNGGFMGIINNLPRDEASLQALIDEMNELNRMISPK